MPFGHLGGLNFANLGTCGHSFYQKSSDLLKEYRQKTSRISEKLRQGLEYMLNHWQELAGYVNFGNVLIDNNCCERTVRPFTNLRKNFGGFSSRSGGETTPFT